MNKALFLDRDGVINVHHGYTFRKEDFIFIESIFETCRRYAADGFLIIIITNQAGIAKGLFTLEDFNELTDWMTEQFRKEGVTISQVYHCPHHPDITGPCECRKPAPGMINAAIEKYDLNIGQCVLIGDKDTDLEAGQRAGIPESNLIRYSPS